MNYRLKVGKFLPIKSHFLEFFGVLGIFFYPLPIFLGDLNSDYVNLTISFQIIGSCFTAFLFFKDLWQKPLNKYFPLYWLFVLFLTFSFYPVFLLVSNYFKIQYFLHFLLCTFILYLFVFSFRFVFFSHFLSILFFFIFFQNFRAPIKNFLLINNLSLFFYSIILFLFFSFLIKIFQTSLDETAKESDNEKNRILENFSSGLGHELKNFLACIEAENTVLFRSLEEYSVKKNKPILPPVYIQQRNKILNLIQTASKSISFFHTRIKKIEKVEDKIFPISACIQKTLDICPFSEKEKDKIKIQITRDFFVMGDDNLLSYVFLNLIQNALRAIKNKKDGYVLIETNNVEDIVKIEDNGIGIDKNDIPHIFDKFFSKSSKGTGLGLYFCKNVLGLMNGEIYCSSEKNKFTKFVILFA